MLPRIVLASLALVLVGMYAVRATGADREKMGCCGMMAHEDHATAGNDAANEGCPMMAKDAESGPHALATSRPAKAATVYRCPMDPEVVSSKSGKCPKCGMNLVPRQEKPKTDKKPADSGQTHNH